VVGARMTGRPAQPNVKAGAVGSPIMPETFYIAECAACRERPEADGEEYGSNPEEATTIALNCGWWLSPNGILYCEDCRPTGTSSA
jgi:hypothetical protein